jgi:hypothetical protein
VSNFLLVYLFSHYLALITSELLLEMKKSAAQAPADALKTPSQNSACCIIPPYELWESIQSIRAEHDKSYPKVCSLAISFVAFSQL